MFVNSDGHCATVKRSERARKALEGVEQGDFLFVDQVVTGATVALMLNLLELNNEVGCLVARLLVTHLFEYKLSAFGVTRLDLNLLTAWN